MKNDAFWENQENSGKITDNNNHSNNVSSINNKKLTDTDIVQTEKISSPIVEEIFDTSNLDTVSKLVSYRLRQGTRLTYQLLT